MHSINRGFWRSAVISTIGFLAFGYVYLHFDEAYIVERGIDKGMFQELYDNESIRAELSLESSGTERMAERVKELRDLRMAGPERGKHAEARSGSRNVPHRGAVAWRRNSPPRGERNSPTKRYSSRRPARTTSTRSSRN